MYQVNKYYEHSGAIGLMGPIYMIILGSVGTLILSVIYGYAIFYIPFIYINFFITIGFGGGVGFLVGIGGKLGKVRNSKAMLLFGFIFGFFAEYAGWVSWIYAISKEETLALIPSSIWNIINVISGSGAWSILGWTPTGTAIYIIWGIEAIMIVGLSTIVAWAVLSSTPFCEHCNKWIEEKDSIAPLEPISNPDDMKSRLEQGDYEFLKSLNTKDSKTDSYTQINLLHCPDCQQNHFLTIKSIVVSLDSNNKEKRDEKDILENLIITPEHYRSIKQQWSFGNQKTENAKK